MPGANSVPPGAVGPLPGGGEIADKMLFIYSFIVGLLVCVAGIQGLKGAASGAGLGAKLNEVRAQLGSGDGNGG